MLTRRNSEPRGMAAVGIISAPAILSRPPAPRGEPVPCPRGGALSEHQPSKGNVMEVRQPVHSEHARTLDTAGLRRHFLIEKIFIPGQITLTYSQIDRIIVGGICPINGELVFAPEL